MVVSGVSQPKVDANCWLEWRLTPHKLIHSCRFESCPDCSYKTIVYNMTREQLERLLETAQNIIMALEHHADEALQNDIEVFFQEILNSDDEKTKG